MHYGRHSCGSVMCVIVYRSVKVLSFIVQMCTIHWMRGGQLTVPNIIIHSLKAFLPIDISWMRMSLTGEGGKIKREVWNGEQRWWDKMHAENQWIGLTVQRRLGDRQVSRGGKCSAIGRPEENRMWKESVKASDEHEPKRTEIGATTPTKTDLVSCAHPNGNDHLPKAAIGNPFFAGPAGTRRPSGRD